MARLLSREKQYAYDILYLKASEYQPGQPFSDVSGASSRAIITQCADFAELSAWPLTDLAACLQQHARGRPGAGSTGPPLANHP